VFSPTDVMELL